MNELPVYGLHGSKHCGYKILHQLVDGNNTILIPLCSIAMLSPTILIKIIIYHGISPIIC